MAPEIVKRWLVLGGLLLLTIWLVWTVPAAEDKSSLVVVNPIRTALLVDNVNVKSDDKDSFSLAPRLLNDGNVVDIFSTEKQQIKNEVKSVITKVKPIVESTAPMLPFKYVGKLVENEVTKLFLMEGEALHIVSQGDKIGTNYKVKQVNEQQISLLYLPLNTTQTMSIGRAP